MGKADFAYLLLPLKKAFFPTRLYVLQKLSFLAGKDRRQVRKSLGQCLFHVIRALKRGRKRKPFQRYKVKWKERLFFWREK
jgi:hypothetical protein